MDMDLKGGSIGKGILLAFGLLLGLVAIIGGIFLAIYIYSIVLGAVFQVATGNESTLPITSATGVFLNATEQSYFTTAGQVTAGAEFAGSLIPIAVILLVFGGLLVGAIVGYQAYKKKKGDKDMGY